MDKTTIDRLKGTLIVPAGLTVALIPFSLLIGWNLVSMVAFWLLITPFLTVYLPTVASGSRYKLSKSIAGMLMFYGLMVILIFEHSGTDYFKVMLFSAWINVLVVGVFLRATQKEAGV